MSLEYRQPEQDRTYSFRTVVPEGTFFSDHLTRERFAAMRRVHQLGSQLAAEHPEVADAYRDMSQLPTYFDIAAQFIPDLYDQNPMFASRVVGHAVRSLIPMEEQEAITSERRARYLQNRFAAMSEEEYRGHQSNAASKRNVLHSNIEAMIRGRGQLPWSEEEKRIVLELMIYDPEYQHDTGSMAGHPDYARIADDINLIYHQGNAIRLTRHVSQMVRDEWRKQRNKQKKASSNF